MTTITKVRFVRAADPMGRKLIEAAADLWDGKLPDPDQNEYLRGQVETLINVIRVIPEPFDDNWVEYDEQRYIVAALIQAVLDHRLDDELKKRGLL